MTRVTLQPTRLDPELFWCLLALQERQGESIQEVNPKKQKSRFFQECFLPSTDTLQQPWPQHDNTFRVVQGMAALRVPNILRLKKYGL